ncbi:hypothetical protein DGG96_11735 [Legionella qingyii]|uniref:Uncharacterized protein n=1 Tax=Legionella qingyii TaxID=2184757 RepID=A0A317U097_9GAMM|nr:hypothetical protein [Legionella qingyii]PWY55443.1 hypothetical protein DGG96_11735 [Legionella qingyii]RUR21353.1 hypothetical protein ELY20_12700 [Legionella qingyii]RUR24577.1 hypothetical protein ELY16_11535 [Legionella qingyii]
MKLMLVIGINLEITKWSVSESRSPFDEDDYLCVYECITPEEANQMLENIKSAFKMDYPMELDIEEQESLSSEYYLETHGIYVVASMKFLERYFDGKVQEVHPEDKFGNKSFYIYKSKMGQDDNSRARLIIVNTSKDSLTIKRISPEQIEESELIDFSEEYLGATSYTKRNKGSAQIKAAYNFNGLFLPGDNFNVLWLPAKPHQGHAMFTAYGCTNHKIAKMLEAKIRDDEKRKQKETPLVINSEHITLVCEGPILLASGNYLEQMYGKPIHVSLVNDLVRRGLADKQAQQRATAVDKIYAEWDAKVQLRNQTYLLKQQSRTAPVFFPPQWIPTGPYQKPSCASSFNSENTIVPKPEPLPYPAILMKEKTVVPKPEPLPYPFITGRQSSLTTHEQTKMVAPRAQSIFHESDANEPLKAFTEEEYLGLFQ